MHRKLSEFSVVLFIFDGDVEESVFGVHDHDKLVRCRRIAVLKLTCSSCADTTNSGSHDKTSPDPGISRVDTAMGHIVNKRCSMV